MQCREGDSTAHAFTFKYILHKCNHGSWQGLCFLFFGKFGSSNSIPGQQLSDKNLTFSTRSRSVSRQDCWKVEIQTSGELGPNSGVRRTGHQIASDGLKQTLLLASRGNLVNSVVVTTPCQWRWRRWRRRRRRRRRRTGVISYDICY